jgi:hypothetical protein
MKSIDLKKDLKYLYQPSAKEVELVKVPKFHYLMIDGEGDPNTSHAFHEGVQALYAVAYTLKFMIKKEKQTDYPVTPLEGLWWMDDMTQFTWENKGAWKWTLMILQPAIATKPLFKKAVRQATEKKGLPALSKIRLESYTEGLAVQIMHIGPYAEEAPTVQKLHAAAREHGCELRGKHHEIYLGDPRKSNPDKLKTVLRQPVKKVRSIAQSAD